MAGHAQLHLEAGTMRRDLVVALVAVGGLDDLAHAGHRAAGRHEIEHGVGKRQITVALLDAETMRLPRLIGEIQCVAIGIRTGPGQGALVMSVAKV